MSQKNSIVSFKQKQNIDSPNKKSINSKKSEFGLNLNKGNLSGRSSKFSDNNPASLKRVSVLDGNKLEKKVIDKQRMTISKEAKRLVKGIQKTENLKKKLIEYKSREVSPEDGDKAKPEGEGNSIITYKKNEPIPIRSQLAIELEDPANEIMRPEIQKIMHLTGEINAIAVDYFNLNIIKQELEEEIVELKKNDHTKEATKVLNTVCKIIKLNL